eukprot:3514009-Amphidinium_carterae.2
MSYLHAQQLQSDGELKMHEVSTENDPSDLMTKYLETAKIKKHSETIGLHPYLGNRSINMIGSRGTLRVYDREEANHASRPRPRGTTPQPRQRELQYIEVNETCIVKVDRLENDQQLPGRLQYVAEEAARQDAAIQEYYDYYYNQNNENADIHPDFNKLLQYLRQF